MPFPVAGGNIAKLAYDNADEAKQTANSVKDEFDRVVAEAGSNNPEVVQARGEAATLKDRLDSTDVQLADIVTLNLQNYGAIGGDNLIDNTTIIQQAINSLNDGDTLFVPTNYRLEGTLTINKRIKIKGNGKGILNFHNVDKAIILGDEVSQTYGGMFEDVTIQGYNSNYGIYAKLRADIFAKELTVQGFTNTGIYLERSWISKFQNCYFRSNGIGMQWYDNANASRVTDCTFIYNTVDIQVLGAYGLFIKGNSYEQSQKGIEIVPGNLGTIIISDNYFEDNEMGGVFFSSKDYPTDVYMRNVIIERNHFTCIGNPHSIVIDGYNTDGTSNAHAKIYGVIQDNTIFTDDAQAGFVSGVLLRGWSTYFKCVDNFAVEMVTGAPKNAYLTESTNSLIKTQSFSTEEFTKGFIEMTDINNSGVVVRDSLGGRWKLGVFADGSPNNVKLL